MEGVRSLKAGRIGGPVAVAGGFGFLGSSIADILRRNGREVIQFSRRSGVDIRNFDETYSFLRDTKPEVVINCAANMGGIAYNALKPIEVYEDNFLIGFNLLKASSAAEAEKFVNVIPNCTYPGTAEIYREDGWWDGPMDETVIVYGMPKKALWVHALALKQKTGFNSIHLVFPGLYGPNDHFDPVQSHALAALVKKVVDAKLQGRDRVDIWGTGKPVREWCHVRDAAKGVVLATEKYDDLGIMNIGSGKGYTILGVANMVKEAARWKGDFIFERSKPDGAPRKILDVSKMKATLGWEPAVELQEGIAETVAWYENLRC
jgi:GDP-L-fucose synthase